MIDFKTPFSGVCEQIPHQECTRRSLRGRLQCYIPGSRSFLLRGFPTCGLQRYMPELNPPRGPHGRVCSHVDTISVNLGRMYSALIWSLEIQATSKAQVPAKHVRSLLFLFILNFTSLSITLIANLQDRFLLYATSHDALHPFPLLPFKSIWSASHTSQPCAGQLCRDLRSIPRRHTWSMQ